MLCRYWHWTGTRCTGVPVDIENIKRFPVGIIAPTPSFIKASSLQLVGKIQRSLGPPKCVWEEGVPSYTGIRPPYREHTKNVSLGVKVKLLKAVIFCLTI